MNRIKVLVTSHHYLDYRIVKENGEHFDLGTGQEHINQLTREIGKVIEAIINNKGGLPL